MANFNVANFLQNLEQNQPKTTGTFKPKSDVKIEKVYLSVPTRQGKYQILPIPSEETGLPIAFLNRVREINIPRVITKQNGEQVETTAWIKILPVEGYVHMSQDGRLVSSLTSAEEDLLRQVHASFDTLYNELGGNSKERNPDLNKTIGYMRRRNYSLFFGHCVNHWNLQDPRNPAETNFPALFVCTAKGLNDGFQNSIQDAAITYGDPANWIDKVYSRQVTGREGFLIFNIALGMGGQVGYTLNVQHVVNNQAASVDITQEAMDLMKDPVDTFLGWQASHAEPGRLFNQRLMEDTLATINSQIAAVRATSGMNPNAAAQTSQTAYQSQATQAPQTNDPMLAATRVYSQPAGMSNPQAISAANDDPYGTPPAAQVDPMSQNPVRPSSPFSQPSFGKSPF